MNAEVEAMRDEAAKQVEAIGLAGKIVTCFRMTCEQLAKLKGDPQASQLMAISKDGRSFEWYGLPVVTRGSIADCNMREARPRVPYVDLTRMEGA